MTKEYIDNVEPKGILKGSKKTHKQRINIKKRKKYFKLLITFVLSN